MRSILKSDGLKLLPLRSAMQDLIRIGGVTADSVSEKVVAKNGPYVY